MRGDLRFLFSVCNFDSQWLFEEVNTKINRDRKTTLADWGVIFMFQDALLSTFSDLHPPQLLISMLVNVGRLFGVLLYVVSARLSALSLATIDSSVAER